MSVWIGIRCWKLIKNNLQGFASDWVSSHVNKAEAGFYRYFGWNSVRSFHSAPAELVSECPGNHFKKPDVPAQPHSKTLACLLSDGQQTGKWISLVSLKVRRVFSSFTSIPAPFFRWLLGSELSSTSIKREQDFHRRWNLHDVVGNNAIDNAKPF